MCNHVFVYDIVWLQICERIKYFGISYYLEQARGPIPLHLDSRELCN
jgi:hypothetical protein